MKYSSYLFHTVLLPPNLHYSAEVTTLNLLWLIASIFLDNLLILFLSLLPILDNIYFLLDYERVKLLPSSLSRLAIFNKVNIWESYTFSPNVPTNFSHFCNFSKCPRIFPTLCQTYSLTSTPELPPPKYFSLVL